ncbi:MAG: hypothetical protein Q8P93_03250 [bacterium]|nr:hypothetical protein [bacterium]
MQDSYACLTLGEIRSVLDKLGGEYGARRFLRGELSVSEQTYRWSKDDDGIVYFTVVSNGLSGKQWFDRLQANHVRIYSPTKRILLSSHFVKTDGEIYKVAVLPGELFLDGRRTTPHIFAEAESRGLIKPNVEIACYIREFFPYDEIDAIGLQNIITMHEPIRADSGAGSFLGTRNDRSTKANFLFSYTDKINEDWYVGTGFAFVSKVS